MCTSSRASASPWRPPTRPNLRRGRRASRWRRSTARASSTWSQVRSSLRLGLPRRSAGTHALRSAVAEFLAKHGMDVVEMKCEQREAFVDGKPRRLFFMEGLIAGEAASAKAFADGLKTMQGAFVRRLSLGCDVKRSSRARALCVCSGARRFAAAHRRRAGANLTGSARRARLFGVSYSRRLFHATRRRLLVLTMRIALPTRALPFAFPLLCSFSRCSGAAESATRAPRSAADASAPPSARSRHAFAATRRQVRCLFADRRRSARCALTHAPALLSTPDCCHP